MKRERVMIGINDEFPSYLEQSVHDFMIFSVNKKRLHTKEKREKETKEDKKRTVAPANYFDKHNLRILTNRREFRMSRHISV
jgi:hypothetical protein